MAKEAVVSTFALTYSVQDETTAQPAGGLAERLRDTFGQSSGGHAQAAVLAFPVFLLAYTPCMATAAAQRAEIGLRWTLAGIGIQLAVAWLLATLVFLVGRVLM